MRFARTCIGLVYQCGGRPKAVRYPHRVLHAQTNTGTPCSNPPSCSPFTFSQRLNPSNRPYPLIGCFPSGQQSRKPARLLKTPSKP